MVCNLLEYYVANDIVEQVGVDGYFAADQWHPMSDLGNTVLAWGVACAETFYYSGSLVTDADGSIGTVVSVVSFDGLSITDFNFENSFPYKTSVETFTLGWQDGTPGSYTFAEASVLGVDPNNSDANTANSDDSSDILTNSLEPIPSASPSLAAILTSTTTSSKPTVQGSSTGKGVLISTSESESTSSVTSAESFTPSVTSAVSSTISSRQIQTEATSRTSSNSHITDSSTTTHTSINMAANSSYNLNFITMLAIMSVACAIL